MKQLKYGFRLMWREVPGWMKKFKIGEVGSFDQWNGFKGKCWAWPSECKLSNHQAQTIFWRIFQKKTMTMTQMNVLSKALSFAFELRGGAPGGNWPGVDEVREIVKVQHQLLAAPKGSVIPNLIPTPPEIKIAFTSEWTPENAMSLLPWSQGLVCAKDGFLDGLRPVEDIDRIKKSREVEVDWKNGWMRTGFQGGRAKLCGDKKGTRPWGLWTGCHCAGGEHVGPPEDFWLYVDKEGNPKDGVEITWDTTCPLAALQLVWQTQGENKRRYAKWSTVTGRCMPTTNIADPVAFAIDWFVAQGVCPANRRYDHNSGRKCFARLARHCDLEFPAIFQVVGDLPSTWRDHYDPDLPVSAFTKREQSRDPSVCTVASRTFVLRLLERKQRFVPRMSRAERLAYLQIRHSQGVEAANAALWGGDEWEAMLS